MKYWIWIFIIVSGGSAAEWHTIQGGRWHSVEPMPGDAGFTFLSSSSTGITFTNLLDDKVSVTNRNLLSGSGVALGDVDGDGLCDIYFCSSQAGNRLYRNKGKLQFEDITASAGVDCLGQFSTGATLADVDGDGDLDLLVNSFGNGTRLFLNDGHGRFTEATDAAGLRSKTGSTSFALADIDGDGDLDLYVCNFRPTSVIDRPGTQFRIQQTDRGPVVAFVNGRPTTEPDLADRFVVSPSGDVLELGEADVLYRNEGGGHFKAISFTDGSFLDDQGRPLPEPPHDWGLAAQFHDMNGDGLPDLYVCNDLFTPDRVWINQGGGKFRALSALALRNNSTFSMGVDFGDLNRDGFVDFFTVDMLSRDHTKRMTQVSGGMRSSPPPGLIDYRAQLPRNALQLNRGDGTFAETAFFAGVHASEWSWGPIFLDVDLDGFEDILVANGQLRDFQNGDLAMALEGIKTGAGFSYDQVLELMKGFPGLFTPNVAFRNRGDATFEDVGAKWGFAVPMISQGMAVADLDGDGDLDVVVNNLKQEAGVLRNNTGKPRVAVHLKGEGANGSGIGAFIQLRGGAVPEQSQEMISGGRYLSGDQALRVFAAGDVDRVMNLEVRWRSGKVSRMADVRANRLYEVNEAEATSSPRSTPSVPSPFFSDASSLLQHMHHEEPFDDFARQPLLPRKLSQLGPGVAWGDLDGDGWEDLVIGSARGRAPAAYLNQQGHGFTLWTNVPFNRAVGRDQTGLVFLNGVLLAGASNWEDAQTNAGALRLYDAKRKLSGEVITGVEAATGPICLADVDGDGDLDLFVGGRAIAGRYPEAAPSKLMRNDGGRFVLGQRFEKLGLVTGAVFSDIDGDGDVDLVVVAEWGPVRVFINEGGKFSEREMGLKNTEGWWNSVITADVDGDGRLDIIAGNWGLNHPYSTSVEHPRRLYFGDLRGSGGVDMVESYFEPQLKMEVPERNLLVVGNSLPFLREGAGTFEAYGKASIETLYGERLKELQHLKVTLMESTVFLNRGQSFEAHALPREAQWSPVFGLAAADLDGDGHEDLIVSQNFFGTAGDGWRQDAGRGLVLLGDGKGGFLTVKESGLRVYGEGRGLAVADYDGDGRCDVVMAQNGAPTMLYHNETARPGIRMRLVGAGGNESAIGAMYRAEREGKWGPARELKAGSGYLSQDSTTQIVAANPAPTRVIVRWPGTIQWSTNTVPTGVKEFTLRASAP